MVEVQVLQEQKSAMLPTVSKPEPPRVIEKLRSGDITTCFFMETTTRNKSIIMIKLNYQ
jgi:hypothetical protein